MALRKQSPWTIMRSSIRTTVRISTTRMIRTTIFKSSTHYGLKVHLRTVDIWQYYMDIYIYICSAPNLELVLRWVNVRGGLRRMHYCLIAKENVVLQCSCS